MPIPGDSFLAAIPSGLETGLPPKEFLIFAFGTTDTTNGKYSFDKDAAEAVLRAATDYGNRLTIDYEHQALSDPPVRAPAAGRYRLELRDDGLWAVDVEWTPDALKYLTNKEYLYYSPAFLRDDKGRPKRLLNVALTNLPATKHMTPLVAAKGAHMKKCSACKMDMADGDGGVCADCYRAVSTMSQLTTLTGKATPAEAMAAVQGWKIAADEIAQLKAQLATEREKTEAQQFDALVADAKAKRLLAKDDSHKRNVVALSFKGKPDAVAQLSSMLSALDPIVGAAEPAHEPTGKVNPAGAMVLSADVSKMLGQLGMAPEKFAEATKNYRRISQGEE